MGEPTQEQITAGMRVLLEYYPDARESRSAIYGIYRAMEAAKPKTPTEEMTIRSLQQPIRFPGE